MRIKSIMTAGILAVFTAANVNAQEPKKVSSRLKEATVYFKGAELVHTASASIPKGASEVMIGGLSPNIDINSIKIGTGNSVIVSSYEFSVDHLAQEKSSPAALKKLKDSLDIYQAESDKVNIDLKTNKSMIELLNAGTTKSVSGSESALGINELMKTMDYYKSKAVELETSQLKLQKRKTELSNSIRRINQQISQESLKGAKTSGQLKLSLTAPMAVNTDFTLTYFTPAAGWVPYYDINVISQDNPVSIAAKSKVRQTTGLDWEKVMLTLSTAVPSNGKVAPLFSTWFLKEITFKQPAAAPAAMQNSFSYDPAEVEDVVVVGYGVQSKPQIRGASSLTANAEPIVVIDGMVTTQQELRNIDPDMIKEVSVLKDASATALYGSRAANGAIVVTLKSGMDDYVAETENELNVVYNIQLPYTIPGNGKEQAIDLQTRETKSEYKYYCAPKLDPETYLLAEIGDWEKLGLLSGNANITYDNTYIGTTPIDASSTQEKMTLTLGTDKRVAVKREKMKDFSTTRSLGSNTEQVFAYKITVRNNQNKPVKMVLKDQYPVSAQNNVEVTLRKETTPWTANKEDLGVITWEEEIGAGQTKEYIISYSVKYPKNLRLNL